MPFSSPILPAVGVEIVVECAVDGGVEDEDVALQIRKVGIASDDVGESCVFSAR